MFHECLATHVLLVAWDAEIDSDIHFEIGHEGQDRYQVKLGQMVSNFQIQDFLSKTCLSCSVLSQDFKNVIFM